MLFLLLQRHQQLVKSSCERLLDGDELLAAAMSVSQVMDAVEERIVGLTGKCIVYF